MCLLFGFDRRGLPDGSRFGGVDTSLTLNATFGEEQPGPQGGKEVGVEIAKGDDPQGADNLDDPGAAPSQDLPPDPAAMPEESAAVAESTVEPMTDPPDEGAAVVEPAPPTEPPEELVASASAVKQPGGLAARLASSGAGAEGEGTPDGDAEAGEEGGAGGGARFGSPDGTSFFQINAQGKHFCYVVDCSNSMEEGNTIDVARKELRASLARLDTSRKFQVLFYDAELHFLQKGGDSVLQATDTNRRLARQFINSQQPTGRAMHKLALEAALQSKPDVIFFLTDGEVPELSARDLAELKSTNRRRTQINVVEFGHGAKLERNWLEQLAREHRGSYRYRDIDANQQR